MTDAVNVLVVSQYYPPESADIPAHVATYLRQEGHKVRVLTGFPNYPHGRLFPGFHQRWRTRSIDNGVPVLRVPLFVDHSHRPILRMLNYLSFALSSASARRFSRGADVIYVYATQMTPALGPWLWKLTGGAPYVLHVQDLWPETVTSSALSGKAGRIFDALLTPWVNAVYRSAAHIIAIAPRMAETLRQRGGGDRVSVVYNWARFSKPSSVSSTARDADTQTRIVYAGNLGEMQDLTTVVLAAHSVADEGVVLRLIGEGVEAERLRQLVASLGVSNVMVERVMSREEIAEVYSHSDFGLVSLRDEPLFWGTIPSKFQDLLGAGVPVITNIQGDVRDLVESWQLGLAADPGVPGLAQAFRQSALSTAAERKDFARNALATADQLFNRERVLAQLTDILIQSVRGRAHGASN